MREVCDLSMFTDGTWIPLLENNGNWSDTVEDMTKETKSKNSLYELSFKTENDGKIELIDSLYVHDGIVYVELPVELIEPFLEALRAKTNLS